MFVKNLKLEALARTQPVHGGTPAPASPDTPGEALPACRPPQGRRAGPPRPETLFVPSLSQAPGTASAQWEDWKASPRDRQVSGVAPSISLGPPV